MSGKMITNAWKRHCFGGISGDFLSPFTLEFHHGYFTNNDWDITMRVSSVITPQIAYGTHCLR